MHLALYRQYRPHVFDAVIGQDHITKTLSNQVISKNISHAYLFTGSHGTGKTSCARIFARAINCLDNQNGSPCGKCEKCLTLNELNSTDIIELDAASNNKVDEIRDLREKVKYPPIIANKKVYIIDEVHMLTDSAFNALLKTLEEPPSHAVFILATTEVQKLPATILSRCMRFDFKLVSVKELSNLLKEVFTNNKISFDSQSITAITTSAEGSVRDALSVADAVASFCNNNITIDKTLAITGQTRISYLSDLIGAILYSDIKGFLQNMQNIVNSSKNISVLCKEIVNYVKILILIKNNISDLSVLNIMPEDYPLLESQAKHTTLKMLTDIFQKVGKTELDLKYSITPQTLLESVCISCMDLSKQSDSKPNLKQADINRMQNELKAKKDEAIAQKENDLSVEQIAESDKENIEQNIELNKNITEQPAEFDQNLTEQNTDFQKKTNDINLEENVKEYTKDSTEQEHTENLSTVEQAEQIENLSDDKNKEIQQPIQQNNIDIEKLWGMLLISIKERNMFALSTALKSAYDVKLKDNTVSIKTNDKHSFDIITESNRKLIILNILKQHNNNIHKLEVIMDQNTKTMDNIIIELKELFGNKIKFED